MAENYPKVKGLVLSGGKSTRMGKDKAEILYHYQPQLNHIVNQIQKLLPDVYISANEPTNNYPPEKWIIDQFKQRGPLNGILSAMSFDPKAAWLVIPIDLPLLTIETLSKLLEARNPSVFATALKKKNSEIPEPLIAIYEPKCYPKLSKQNSNSPLDFLKNNPTELIEPNSDIELLNCNTPVDFEIALRYIRNL